MHVLMAPGRAAHGAKLPEEETCAQDMIHHDVRPFVSMRKTQLQGRSAGYHGKIAADVCWSRLPIKPIITIIIWCR